MKNVKNEIVVANTQSVEVVESPVKEALVEMDVKEVAPEVAPTVEKSEGNSTKKVSLRQDFLKGFSAIVKKDVEVCELVGMKKADFDKMVEYFNTQINKTNTVKDGDYKPTEKAQTILEILIAFEGEFKTGKEIAEGSQGTLKANGVSGSIRGLIAHNMVEATNDTPKKYKITQVGIDFLNSQD